MQYTNVGNSDLRVSRIGFGTWPIGGTHGKDDYGPVDDRTAIEAIRYALDLGITVFDTAPAYGHGRAEEILAKALAGRRDEVVLVTKCGLHWSEERDWYSDSSRTAIIEGVEQSLVRLQTEVIDLLLIHSPDFTTPPTEPMEALAELREQGKIRYVGVSNFSLELLDEYLSLGPLHAQQVSYHMLDRRMERSMIPACRDRGVGVMGFGSLAHGLLSGQWTEETRFPANDWRAEGVIFGLPLLTPENFATNIDVVQRLNTFALEKGTTLPKLAIAWVLRGDVAIALVGAVTPEEVKDDAESAALNLSPEDLTAIDAILSDAAGTSPDAPEYQGD